MNVLISACLLGQYCRYDGQTKVYPQVQDLLGRDDIHLIPVCPEQAGGLFRTDGTDVTAQYRRGAEAALYLARLFHCTKAILKEKSPSCGHGQIYDGTFSRTLTAGDGVTAALLRAEGLEIVGESDLL